MGKRSRHSPKTGDQSIYKSRSKIQSSSNTKCYDDSDDDPMDNEVERYHNRREKENYLQLDVDSDHDGEDGSSEDDGITKHREEVFDTGIGGSSDDHENNEEGASEEEEETAACRAKAVRVATIEAALASSDDSEDSEDDEDGGSKAQLLNWGKKKHSYYHGDTADLEIGQDVQDAFLEEEAGREVEMARMDVMDDTDFMLDAEREEGATEEEGYNLQKNKIPKKDTRMGITSAQKLSKLSRKEKHKLLKANHPELLPLVQHLSGPLHEFSKITMVAAGALLKNGVRKAGKEAEAVGATRAGLQYLITKSMLQASSALNLSLYLLLKLDQSSKIDHDTNMSFMDDSDGGDGIRNHPVIDRLNELSQLTDKLRAGVEDKMPGLRIQLNSLVKAATLMAGGNLSSSDDSDNHDENDKETHSSQLQYNAKGAVEYISERVASNDDYNSADNAESTSEIEDEEKETEELLRWRIMTEAKFALRPEDIKNDNAKSTKKQKCPLVQLASPDYGDEVEEVTDRELAAGRNLASTMNSIVQKSSACYVKKRLVGDDDEGRYEAHSGFQLGLSMIEEEFGMGSGITNRVVEEGGLQESDGNDDFYDSIKSKIRARKEVKNQMYTVAPKYPRLEGEVEGERAISRMIMKNRGLVAHKATINRNPRVKKREQYRRALIRRKGAVREVRTNEGHAYGGEITGIKSGISRSRKFGGGGR